MLNQKYVNPLYSLDYLSDHLIYISFSFIDVAILVFLMKAFHENILVADSFINGIFVYLGLFIH